MRYLSSLLISFITFLLLTTTSMFGTHFQGVNISYECMSGCTYRMYVTEYFDCSGIINPPPGNVAGTFAITPNGACTAPTPVTTGWTSVSFSEVTPVCPSSLGLTTCNGGTGSIPGIAEVKHYRDYDFCSSTCTDYNVSYTHCCRNGASLNTLNPGSYSVHLSMDIYPNGICNSSPQFLDPSPVYIEAGEFSRVSMAAEDEDGDSLAYTMASCYSAAGQSLIYNPGYAASQPLGFSWAVNLDPRTGDLTFNPIPGNIGSYIVCIQVAEYRNGVLLGEYRNDFIVTALAGSVITNTNPSLPYFGFGSPPVTGGTYIDSFIVSATVGNNVTIPIYASDPDMDSVRMAWSENITGATFTQVGNPSVMDTIFDEDPEAIFSWTPPSPGRYSFTVDLEDDGCYVVGTSEFTYIIDVAGITCNVLVDLGPDVQACDGDSILLIPFVTGGIPPYSYLWSTGATTPNIYVNMAGTYIVWVTDSNNCTESDTIVIGYHPPVLANAGIDTTICGGETVQLNGSSSPAGVVYQWTPATNLNDPNIANPIFSAPVSSTTMSYTFQMDAIDANGCGGDDIVVITVLDLPSFSISANDTICSADTALITYTGPAGLTYTWDFDGGTIITGSGSGPYEIAWAGTGFGNKQVSLTVDTGTCDHTETIDIFVDPNCVWPGDADYDGIANNNDLLALGLTFGNTGPARSNASILWTAQPATPWNDTIPGGVNYVHSDTDGNGTVNDDDTLAITTNYGLTHNKTTEEGGPGDAPLLLLPVIDSALTGQTLQLPIVLGLDTIPAADVYGLAFTITYDNTLVDSSTAKVDFQSSWLGNNLLSIQKDFFSDGQIDVAVTRKDLMNVTGFGNLGYFSIVMVDDISGKNEVSEILKLDITNVRMISSDGSIIPVNPEPTEIVLSETSSTGIDKWAKLTGVKVYPNPSQGLLFIETETSEELNIEIFNLQGQRIKAITSRETKLQIDLGDEARGLYLISISNKTSRFTQKIQLTR